jgi:hypothetical protein
MYWMIGTDGVAVNVATNNLSPAHTSSKAIVFMMVFMVVVVFVVMFMFVTAAAFIACILWTCSAKAGSFVVVFLFNDSSISIAVVYWVEYRCSISVEELHVVAGFVDVDSSVWLRFAIDSLFLRIPSFTSMIPDMVATTVSMSMIM